MHSDVSCAVRRRASQLRRALFIAANHAFRQRRAHEISCFYETFSSTALAGSFAMTRCDLALLEGALANYVVPGALPPTTHSGDAVLMRFRAFT